MDNNMKLPEMPAEEPELYAKPQASQLPGKAKMPTSVLETGMVEMRLGRLKKSIFW